MKAEQRDSWRDSLLRLDDLRAHPEGHPGPLDEVAIDRQIALHRSNIESMGDDLDRLMGEVSAEEQTLSDLLNQKPGR